MAYSRQVINRLKTPVKDDKAAIQLIELSLAKRGVQRTQNNCNDLVACINIVHESGLPLSESFTQSMKSQFTPNITELLNLTEEQLASASRILQSLSKTENHASELDQLTFERIIHFVKNNNQERAIIVSNVMNQMRAHGIPITGNRRELLELQDYQLDYLHVVLLQLDNGKNLDANTFKVLLRHAQGMRVALGDPQQTQRELSEAETHKNTLKQNYDRSFQVYQNERVRFIELERLYDDIHTQMVPDPTEEHPQQQRREVIVSAKQTEALRAITNLRTQLQEMHTALDRQIREVINPQDTEIERLKGIRDRAHTGVSLGFVINRLVKSDINLNHSLGGNRIEPLLHLDTRRLNNIEALLQVLSEAKPEAQDKNNHLDARTFDFIMKEMDRADSTMLDNRRDSIKVFSKMRTFNIPLKGSRQDILTMNKASLKFLNSVLNAEVDASTFATLRNLASNLSLTKDAAEKLGTAVKDLMVTMKTNGISDTEWLKHDKLSKLVELPEASLKHINSIFTVLARINEDDVKGLDQKTAHYIINNAATIGVDKLEAIADVFTFMQANCPDAIVGNRQPLMKLDSPELVVLLALMENIKNTHVDEFKMDAKQVGALINKAKESKAELYTQQVANAQAVEEDENPTTRFKNQVAVLSQARDRLTEKSEAALTENTSWKSKLGL